MRVLVPMDGSQCSRRALEHAVDVFGPRGAVVDVVHLTDVRNDVTADLVDGIREIRLDREVPGDTEVITDLRLSDPRSSKRIGRRICKLVSDRGYDHVVMGHHGTGLIEDVLLGSTAKTVIDVTDVPVTVIS